MTSRESDAIDFDLHGLAAVRLLGAGPGDATAVERQLGPVGGRLEREPDVVVRFVDRLETRGRVRLVGLRDAAFTDDSFLVLRGRRKAPVRVRLPLADAGGAIEVTCERGVPAVPLLVPLLNLAVLAHGVLPLHASAFVHEGVGIVATGWSKGGKTEALLGFAAAGAAYVGDEWVYVAEGGRRVYGIPEPVRLWHWHLRQLRSARAAVGAAERLRLGALAAAVRAADRPAGGLVRRAEPLLERRLGVDVPPAELFERRERAADFDRLFLLVSHEEPAIRVEEVDPLVVADRIVHSLQYERLPFVGAYRKFRFAFPEQASALVEQAEERERALLREAFAGKPAWEVGHPYPVSLADLREAMAAVL